MSLRARFILVALSMATIVMTILMSSGSASALPQVSAGDIIRQVSDGSDAYYDGVLVVGNLDLTGLPDHRVRGSFVITNSSISQANFAGTAFDRYALFWGTALTNASFNNANFNALSDFSGTSLDNASFKGCVFKGPLSFDGARFNSDVSFTDSLFQKDASFNRALFLGDANFNYTNFVYYSYFSGAQFRGSALFSDVTFDGACDFSDANFTMGANFFQSLFNDVAAFDGAFFGGRSQFGLTKFGGLSSFGSAIFASEAVFALAHFSDAAYFSGAHFMDDTIFGLTKFDDIASFQGAAFDGRLNLKAAKISTFLLDGARFGKASRITLNDTEFARLKAHWNEINDYVIYDAGAYLALIDNYHGLGWHSDEDDCYYRYRRLDQAAKPWGWSKLIDAVAWLSCGYGVRPGYAVIWSIMTILIFAGVFWQGDGIRRSAKPLRGESEIDPLPERAVLRNALFFSTMVFLSQGPIDFLPVGRHRYYVIIEGILGWLLTALFLVTLGRIMIR